MNKPCKFTRGGRGEGGGGKGKSTTQKENPFLKRRHVFLTTHTFADIEGHRLLRRRKTNIVGNEEEAMNNIRDCESLPMKDETPCDFAIPPFPCGDRQ